MNTSKITKIIIPKLTWVKQDGFDRWSAKEYPFHIMSSSNYHVKKYDLYDNDKLVEGINYALINAQDVAKKLLRKKIKKGEFIPKPKEEKKAKPTVSYYDVPRPLTEEELRIFSTQMTVAPATEAQIEAPQPMRNSELEANPVASPISVAASALATDIAASFPRTDPAQLTPTPDLAVTINTENQIAQMAGEAYICDQFEVDEAELDGEEVPW